MSLENFKNFVRRRPILASYVSSGVMSWQKFYEMYALYGESSTVWDKFLNNNSTVTLKDVFGMIKNIDVSELQHSIITIQKGIGYIEGLVSEKEKELKPVYEARPLYKYFDD